MKCHEYSQSDQHSSWVLFVSLVGAQYVQNTTNVAQHNNKKMRLARRNHSTFFFNFISYLIILSRQEEKVLINTCKKVKPTHAHT
jgi:hypothetical protein